MTYVLTVLNIKKKSCNSDVDYKGIGYRPSSSLTLLFTPARPRQESVKEGC